MVSMKSIKKDKKKADKKAKKEYSDRNSDIKAIHNELKSYLTGMSSGISQDYDNSISSVNSAGEALKSRLATDTELNRNNAMSELERLGLGSVGLGRFDADAAVSAQGADRATSDVINNLLLSQANAGSNTNLLTGMSEGQRTSALGDSLKRYEDAKELNKEAYDRMVEKYKEQQAAARRAAAYSRRRYNYGGYRSYNRGGYSAPKPMTITGSGSGRVPKQDMNIKPKGLMGSVMSAINTAIAIGKIAKRTSK